MEVIDGVTGQAGNSTPNPSAVDWFDSGLATVRTCSLGAMTVSFVESRNKFGEKLISIVNVNRRDDTYAERYIVESPTGMPNIVTPTSDYKIEKKEEKEPNRINGPTQFVTKLMDFWNLEIADAVFLLGFDERDTDYVESALKGNGQFRGNDVTYRISNLFWIRNSLRLLFRDLQVENEWLREQHPLLDERTPLSLMLSGSIEDLLLVKEYVDRVSGR